MSSIEFQQFSCWLFYYRLHSPLHTYTGARTTMKPKWNNSNDENARTCHKNWVYINKNKMPSNKTNIISVNCCQMKLKYLACFGVGSSDWASDSSIHSIRWKRLEMGNCCFRFWWPPRRFFFSLVIRCCFLVPNWESEELSNRYWHHGKFRTNACSKFSVCMSARLTPVFGLKHFYCFMFQKCSVSACVTYCVSVWTFFTVVCVYSMWNLHFFVVKNSKWM